MRRHYWLPIIAVLLGGVAIALPSNITRSLNLGVTTGLYLGPAANWSSTNVITKTWAANGDFDFASVSTTCEDSSGITATGASVGDTCFVGVDATGYSANGVFTCYVSAANTVKVRHCGVGTADNPADAGYRVRGFSNQ